LLLRLSKWLVGKAEKRKEGKEKAKMNAPSATEKNREK
jgi:hypothetical protein